MSERYAFFITRDNQLKVVAPVIDYLIRKSGNRTRPLVIFHTDTSKPASQPTDESVRSIFGEQVETRAIDQGSELIEMARKGEFSVWLNITTRFHEISEDEFASFARICRGQGIKIVALPHTFETEMFVVEKRESAARDWDLITLVGPRSKAYIEQALSQETKETRDRILKKCVVTGYPELDQLESFDQSKIRQKLGLPPERPIICLSTAALYYRDQGVTKFTGERFRGFSGLGPKRMKGWLDGLKGTKVVTYRRYLSALSKMARRNGALLVGKTRQKHNDPEYLNKYVDIVFQDQEFYPFTTLELLAVSSVYFGFYSTMAVESVASGNYAFTFIHIPPDLVELPALYRAADFLYLARGASWNYAGASEMIMGSDSRTPGRLKALSRCSLEEFKIRPECLEAWRREFMSAPGRASANVVSAIEAL